MKKNSIILTIFNILSLTTCFFMLIFCVSSTVALFIGPTGIIIYSGSKWLLAIPLALFTAIIALSIFAKNKQLKTLFKSATFVFSIINLLIFVYYSIDNSMAAGENFKLPISLIVFVPISFLIIVWSNLLKNLPFKNSLGIKNKHSLETEFLWTQIHFLAKDCFFALGTILMLIALIFCIFQQFWIEFALFLIFILSSIIIFTKKSKSIFNKYIEMKNRKDALEKNKNNEKK